MPEYFRTGDYALNMHGVIFQADSRGMRVSYTSFDGVLIFSLTLQISFAAVNSSLFIE